MRCAVKLNEEGSDQHSLFQDLGKARASLLREKDATMFENIRLLMVQVKMKQRGLGSG